jgi:imidazoleglycerol phosphate dehydratase HisB
MALRIAANEELAAFHAHQPVQDVALAAGPALDEQDVSRHRRGCQRFEHHDRALVHEGAHAAAGDGQTDLLPPFERGADDGHQFASSG